MTPRGGFFFHDKKNATPKVRRKRNTGSCMCPIRDGNDVVYSVLRVLNLFLFPLPGGERDGWGWDEGEGSNEVTLGLPPVSQSHDLLLPLYSMYVIPQKTS